MSSHEITDRYLRPPGGSSFGGDFHKDAFGAYVYPQPGRNTDVGQRERRTQRKDHKFLTHGDEKHFAANLQYTVGAESIKPSRLLKEVSKYTDSKANLPLTMQQKALMRKSASSIDLGSADSTSSSMQFGPGGSINSDRSHYSEFASEIPVMQPTGRWYPHQSSLRGKLKVCEPRALESGFDPQYPAGQCGFFEAPQHRFAKLASHAEAVPRVPARSLRWQHDDHWNNPMSHGSLKVTHMVPRRSKDVMP